MAILTASQTPEKCLTIGYQMRCLPLVSMLTSDSVGPVYDVNRNNINIDRIALPSKVTYYTYV